MLKKIVLIVLLVLLLAFGAIQLVPVERTNPPVTAEIAAPPEVAAVIERCCYDCHSNETAWPWYAYVAPASWLVADDVHEGRRHMNFSEWGGYDARRQDRMRGDIWDEVSADEMPPGNYLLMHSSARLTDADRAVLRAWTGAGEDDHGAGDAGEGDGDDD